MTIEYYNDREEIARAFDDAADAAREEKRAAGAESLGKYYHVKRQLRREIWAEEDNPPTVGDWSLLRLFNAYAATVDTNAAETDAGKRELFFYLRSFLFDKICERLEIENDRILAGAADDTLERMTERRRAAKRANAKQEETE